jgi:hypothetical protein
MRKKKLMICKCSKGWGNLLTVGKTYEIISGETDSFGTVRSTYFKSDNGNNYILETKDIIEKYFMTIGEMRHEKLKQIGI